VAPREWSFLDVPTATNIGTKTK